MLLAIAKWSSGLLGLLGNSAGTGQEVAILWAVGGKMEYALVNSKSCREMREMCLS